MDQRIEKARDDCIVRIDRPEDAFAVRRTVFVE